MASAVLQKSRKNKAVRLFQAKRFEEARKVLHTLCTKGCKDAEVWCLLAGIEGELGDYESSIRCCRKAVALAPHYLEAHYNLAQACMHAGRLEEAVEAYGKVLELKPDHRDANNSIALALETLGRLREAARYYERAYKLDPANVKVLLNLANLSSAIGDKGYGLGYIRQALNLEPDNLDAMLAMAHALNREGQFEEALAWFERVREREPEHPGVAVGLAVMHERKGDFEAAFRAVEPLLGTAQDRPEVAVVFARIARHLDRHEEAVAMLERVLGQNDQPGTELQPVHFQLGKLYDEVKEYEKAFRHFVEANALGADYVEAERVLEVMDAQRHLCDRTFFEGLPRSCLRTQRPVFIVGMPRSGTTLTEQILASHPQVAGCGERDAIGGLVQRLPRVAGQDYPECLPCLQPEFLDKEARAYLQEVADEAGDVARITDKMPHNFLYLPLIAQLFPEARILYCKRDPMDNCLSIFTFEFNASHAYASDLRELGRHYRAHERLMEHWKRVLPLPILEVRYEDTVADQEAQTRRILEFCGLPWDDACLRFYESKRVVNTFSYDQVRQPIYKKSVQRWRNYEPWLEPLKEALEGK